jgi:hypothetical protein
VRLILGSVAALAAAMGVSVSTAAAATHAATRTASAGQSSRLVPSRAAAQRATIKEVNREHHNLGLKSRFVKSSEKWHVSCIALTRRLYRCDWKVRVIAGATTTWTGRSKVRFYSLATDVALYQVNCNGLVCAGI